MSSEQRRPLILAVLAFGLFTFLSLNWHSHGEKFDYRSEIWADRAGYHAFLPAWFDYGLSGDRFPHGIDVRTGKGFRLDSIPGKVVTRYTCGEAILRIPFYLTGKLLRTDTADAPGGFTRLDHAMIDVAASFYAALGGLLLYLVLRRRSSGQAAALALVVTFTGTNLLFYTIGDSGMSHVYSFFLFAAWLFVLDRSVGRPITVSGSLFKGAIAGLIVLIRPTNVVFLPLSFLLLSTNIGDAWRDLRALLKPNGLPWLFLGALLPWLPQFHYWNTTFGSPIVWSYGGEGFSNLLSPSFIPFWFAPYNGLFLYAPAMLVVLVITMRRYRQQRAMHVAVLASFAWVSFFSTAWFAWTFGCGFGSRNFVEYAAVFAFPLATNLTMPRQRLVGSLLALCCVYTLKLTFSSPNCWFGTIWDWSMFADRLFGPFM